MRILICGAGGNLGGLVAERLLASGHELTLMWHAQVPPAALRDDPRTGLVQADLGDPASLPPAFESAQVVVHLAGRLFLPRPERFLSAANIGYMENIVRAATSSDVRRLVFVSFPQVEGPTTPDHPALGRLEGHPLSVHAKTRLLAERRMFALTDGTSVVPIVLRSGVVYGPGVKLLEAARRLMSLGLMAVWPRPTWYHFIALEDFLRGVGVAVEHPGLRGIYPLGDDRPVTLQVFLDRLADHWGYRRPWRLPPTFFRGAAGLVELLAMILHTPAPLTRDMIKLGQVDHTMDTSRMKAELLPELVYPAFNDGLTQL